MENTKSPLPQGAQPEFYKNEIFGIYFANKMEKSIPCFITLKYVQNIIFSYSLYHVKI